MAVSKKDQERVTYAWMYGQQAHKDSRERIVPDYWAEHAEAWLQGFDGVPLGSELASPVSDELEAELDDAAVTRST
ncbi:MAG: hypothetical protein EOR68_10430 [Mesorhizobium sp.]|uniref:hypothetical protein n=1 Tax=Mesorhizobium sp. TaxID=1871066 RepID=UPI000FEAA158|nr:hypothetical protein [Mesorhizobium sp.]RWL84117.1 MAG: hypothetical protein EOR69_07695 [Mesorhizobium sp.]RWL88596.1 MAG: hypothetical protein EOR67_11535 [Mesorhizobium sp.]RWM00813.1 MAG: hypothetical protein EOR68_10430 [Mesorhizobium sp.]RWM03530.1 MAG: hypothetical protein EOR70_04295 [Mesorhizobium sp.]TIP51461.1 MAG: hypothetical protein E5X77_01415 [Mesorhizobium sp.]